MKDCYKACRLKFPRVPWASSIWCRHIHPKFSILVWKKFHDRLPTDDHLQRRGIRLASVCAHGASPSNIESIFHVFCDCLFAISLWNWLAMVFRTFPPTTICWLEIWKSIESKPFPSQLKNLWMTASLSMIYVIWYSRNKRLFDDCPVNISSRSIIVSLEKDCPS
ncbi:hypothetical protein Ddye_011519 [Dipteronia dyeriana]|uniref:Reverse transcriptase zinc-binding domain-containing protein n=1 Tax=Dipteronia dyeriana TaxID=168575 RepID=A0AAD9X2N5_9ROSI|nr:hypothetical protein Ddye_011519 [Dipteronia dyeriana]